MSRSVVIRNRRAHDVMIVGKTSDLVGDRVRTRIGKPELVGATGHLRAEVDERENDQKDRRPAKKACEQLS